MDSDVIYCIHSLIGVYRRLFELGGHSRPGAYYCYGRLPPGALSGQALFWDPALFRAITVYLLLMPITFMKNKLFFVLWSTYWLTLLFSDRVLKLVKMYNKKSIKCIKTVFNIKAGDTYGA